MVGAYHPLCERGLVMLRHVAAEKLILQWVAGNAVLFRGPSAKIDQLAALGTKRAAWALRAPFNRRLASRAGDSGDIAHA